MNKNLADGSTMCLKSKHDRQSALLFFLLLVLIGSTSLLLGQDLGNAPQTFVKYGCMSRQSASPELHASSFLRLETCR